MYIRLTLLVVCLFVSQGARAYCIEQWACIEDIPSQQGVSFEVSNQRPYPITVTVVVRTRNLQSLQRRSGYYEQTLVLEGLSSKNILSLSAQDPDSDFDYRDEFHWTPGRMDATHADVSYLKPFAPDASYPVVQGFGGGYSHRGASRYAVDFAMPTGTAVHAARAGTVIDTAAHHRKGGPSRRFARYANYIVILHDDGTTGEYYHLQHQGVVVKRGQQVTAGQLIGYSGNTGFSSVPHLHFAVYRARSHGNFESLPFRFSEV